MTQTTSQAMAAFLESITATKHQKEVLVPARVAKVQEYLEDLFSPESDMPFLKVHLMGSAAKNTVIRPVDDVDTLAVFSNENWAIWKYQRDSKAFLYRVREAYKGVSVQQVGARGQAIRVFFESGGHVDVAPVFEESAGVYLLPNGSGGWMRTSPLEATSWFLRKHSELNYQLAPTVRLLKAWNRAHSSRLQSFHLETMAASCFATLGANRQSALECFFEWAPRNLHVADPGGQSGSLSTYLTQSQQEQVLRSFQLAHARCQLANSFEATGDHQTAKQYWQQNLGKGFPQ